MSLKEKVQYLGIDIGRGYVKGYSFFQGKKYECKFKSIIGRYDSDTELDIDSIVMEHEGKSWLVGRQAENECSNFMVNQSNSKVSRTAKLLLYTVLNEIAMSNTVKICIGVPNNNFRNSILNEIVEAYKGKIVELKDIRKNTTKKILIEDIIIYRESDAALYYTVQTSPNRKELENSILGMVTVGFRTTELTYCNKGKFNNKLSDTLELGNNNVLEVVQKDLKKQGITKKLNEIDSDPKYSKQKSEETEYLLESIFQDVMMKWKNYKEMIIFFAGGTTLNFNSNDVPEYFRKCGDAQMITSKGLFKVAQDHLGKTKRN